MGRVAPVRGWASAAGLFALPARQPAELPAAAADLFARYAIAHDEGDLAAMEDLFLPDARVEVSLGGPPFQQIAGRAAILENFAQVLESQRDQRRHCVTNLVTTADGPGRATAHAYGLVSAASGTDLHLAAACAYTAALALGADGLWRFARLWIGMDNYAGRAPGTR